MTKKARFESIKNEVTFIPEGCIYMNGLMQALTSRQGELTKSELLAFAIELDYQLHMTLNSEQVNRIYDNLFSSGSLADSLGVED